MNNVPSPPVPPNQSAVGNNIAQSSGSGSANVIVFQSALPRVVDRGEVDAAEAHFAALPLNALPERSGLISPHVMPWPPNRFFVGREDSLLMLARRLKDGGVAAIGQSPAVTGMGGQGKTQLAIEFAYRYSHWFRGGVFWVPCDDPATMAEAVAACGPVLHPADSGFTARPLADRVALVSSAWASGLPRLLIFDNCEDEAILDNWVPKGGGCRLLLTARRISWSPARGVEPVPLGQLARLESVALLHHHRPDLLADDPVLDSVAAELGDLPLALELAGSYLARYRDEPSGAPSAYLVELCAHDLLAHISLTVNDPAAPGGVRSLTGHEQDVARTFEVSLRRLQPEASVDALARILFARVAWLEPGVPIPRGLLKLCAQVAANDGEADRRFADAVTRLLDLALVERADMGPANERGAVVLHRLLATFARSRLEEAQAARSTVEEVVADLAEKLLSDKDPRPFRDWAPHLITVANAAKRDNRKTAIRLLNAAGNYSHAMADYKTLATMLEDAVRYSLGEFGPDDPAVAVALSNLSNVQRDRGEFSAAEASLTRALAINEKAYGPNDPKVASSLGSLGTVQRKRGCLAAAEASQTRALAINEKAYEPDHPAVGHTLGDLGILQNERGDSPAAEASQTRALAINEKVYGPDHPEVGRTLGNLGTVQRKRGDLAAAEASQTRALVIKEKAYGPHHPEVGRTLGNLGILQNERGDFAAAEASQTRALAINEKVYGPNHPEVAAAVSNLGIVQHARGDLPAAEAGQTRALAICEKVYGPDHSEVGRILSNLGNVQYERRDFPAAEASQTRALAICEKAYGRDHPEVGRILSNLGNVQDERGDFPAAEASQTRALAIYERVYEPDHLDVGRILSNLGIVQRKLGHLPEAWRSHTRALGIFNARLGYDHPYTAQARQLIADINRQLKGGDYDA